MGCPRPGTSQFGEWFNEKLTSDSMNLIICEETADPVTGKIRYEFDPVAASSAVGFDLHPNCFLLIKNFGTIRPLKVGEKELLSDYSPLVSGQLWDKLHGVLKYYQAMYGNV